MTNNYPLISFHGRAMGSNSSYVQRQIREAKQENAPATAWAKIQGKWATLETCQSSYKEQLEAAWNKSQNKD